jgi:transposase
MRTSTGMEKECGGEALRVDALGRRIWSVDQKQKIVAEALAPDTSVAEVARRHSLNANLIFKWMKQAEEGWPDRRRTLAPRREPMTFVPVELVDATIARAAAIGRSTLESKIAPQSRELPARLVRKPQHETKAVGRRGMIEISLPNGVYVSVDTRVDEATLRVVLSAMKEL